MFRRSGSVPLTVGSVLVVLIVFVVVPKFAHRAITPYQSWNDYSSNAVGTATGTPVEPPSPVKDAEDWFVMLGAGWMHFILGLALLTIIAHAARWYLVNGRTDPNALVENDAWVQSHLREVAANESLNPPRPAPPSDAPVSPDAVQSAAAIEIASVDLPAAPQS